MSFKKMKAVQAWILRNILEKTEVHRTAKAFKKMNITENLKPHEGNRFFYVLILKTFSTLLIFIQFIIYLLH